MLPINRQSSAWLRSASSRPSLRSYSSRSLAGSGMSERAWGKSRSSNLSSWPIPLRLCTTSSLSTSSFSRQTRSITTTTPNFAELSLHDLLSLNTSASSKPSEPETPSTPLLSDESSPEEYLSLYPDLPSAQTAIQKFSSQSDSPSSSDYLLLLRALAHHRPSDSPLKDILTTYNQIISRKVTPSSETISLVIESLCLRDIELGEKLSSSASKVSVPKLAIRPPSRTSLGNPSYNYTKLSPLSPFDRDPFPSAVALLSATQSFPQPIPVSSSALTACVKAAGRRLLPDLAKQFMELSGAGQGSSPQLEYGMFEGLIASYGASNPVIIRRAFQAFRELDEAGEVNEGKKSVGSGVDGRSAVWNAAVLALVQVGDVEGAEELCELMVQGRAKHDGASPSTLESDETSSASPPSFPFAACRSTFAKIASHDQIARTYATSRPNDRFINYAHSLGIPASDLIPIIQPAIIATASNPTASHRILQIAQKWLGKDHLPSDWLLASLAGMLGPEERTRHGKEKSMTEEERRSLALEYVEWVGPKQRKDMEPAMEAIILELFGEQGGFERIARWHDELFTEDDAPSLFLPSPLPDEQAPLPHPPQKYPKNSAARHHHILISHLLLPHTSTTLSPALQLQLILTLVSVASSHGVQTKPLALTADAIFYFTSLFRDATGSVDGDLTQLISTTPWVKAILELAVAHDEFRQLKLGRESSYILPTLLLLLTQAQKQLIPEPLDLPNDAWLRIANLVSHHTPRTPQLSVDLLQPFISPETVRSLQSSIPSYAALSKIEFDYSSAPWQSISTAPIATLASPSPDPTLSERFSTLSDLAALVHKGTETSLKAAYDQVATLLGHKTPVIPAYWLLSQLAADLADHTHSHSRVIQLARFVQSSSHSGKSWDGSDPAAVHANFVVAFSKCGDYVSAEWHYRHLLSLELKPDNRVFSALIACAPDPEGTASVAEKHWDEAKEMGIPREDMFRGVYNALFSAYTRAGLKDKAMSLLRDLQKSPGPDGIRFTPNWATYAMLISVHLKAGDHDGALKQYKRMRKILPQNAPLDVHLKAYPFHEMMNYYIQHAPSRAGFISIFNDMKSFGQAPLPRTYDLMIQAHAHLEPTSEAAVKATFDELVQSGQEVSDENWATFIKSLRASSEDSTSAIAAFESRMSASPSSKSSAVLYEAIIDVCKRDGNSDLTKTYVSQMASNVRLEKDASALIRAYADVSDMEGARAVSESLVDPDPKVTIPTERDLWPLSPSTSFPSPSTSPAYRTPFIWKTMVESEHFHGDKAKARALVGRLKSMDWPGVSRPNGLIRQMEKLLDGKSEFELVEEALARIEKDI